MKQITEDNLIESMNVKDEGIEDQDVCSICIDILEDEVEVMDCSHKYHHDCILEWMKQNPVCPVCRAYIKPMNDFPPLWGIMLILIVSKSVFVFGFYKILKKFGSQNFLLSNFSFGQNVLGQQKLMIFCTWWYQTKQNSGWRVVEVMINKSLQLN